MERENKEKEREREDKERDIQKTWNLNEPTNVVRVNVILDSPFG